MKTFLVTFYLTNGEVHAVRYEIDNEIFKTKIQFQEYIKSQKFVSNMQETINMSNVCRFTVDEIESEE